jgi:hypothetical protein
MKKFQFLLAALVAVVMTSCFKTEATVDVTVTKAGQPQAGVDVYKAVAHGDIGGGYYKENYKEAPVKTNAAGVAHFELKSPDDFAPSSVGADETITVYFAVFDAQDECLAFKSLQVKTGEKNKPLTLELKEPNE